MIKLRMSIFSRSPIFGALVLLTAMINGAGSMGVAKAADIAATDLRIGVHSNKTRLVIEFSHNSAYKIFTLADPYRVVIDLPETEWRLQNKSFPQKSGLISSLRYGLFRADLSRVVLDVAGPVKVKTAFMLPPAEGKGYRFVLDLAKTSRTEFIVDLRSSNQSEMAISSQKKPVQVTEANPRQPLILTPPHATGNGDRKSKFQPGRKPSRSSQPKPVILIDPGHGGVDPGATSRAGVFEKNITLAAARDIKRVLDRTGRYNVYLTRNRDIFIRLRDRIAIARSKKADLFISLHADTIKRRSIRGMSVYTLSEKASDKEAADLAEKENKADLIAGIDLSTESEDVTNILIDLAQRETMNESARVAGGLVAELRKITKMLSNAHRFAGFAVLKAPDVPSILIEMGFLSNREDERALRNKNFRSRMANAMGRAIDTYFSRVQQAQK